MNQALSNEIVLSTPRTFKEALEFAEHDELRCRHGGYERLVTLWDERKLADGETDKTVQILRTAHERGELKFDFRKRVANETSDLWHHVFGSA